LKIIENIAVIGAGVISGAIAKSLLKRKYKGKIIVTTDSRKLAVN
jgi:pyrroline-5-carboxylate reductase